MSEKNMAINNNTQLPRKKKKEFMYSKPSHLHVELII